MKNDNLRKPLLQSAAVLAAVVILAWIAASSGSGHEGGGFFSVLTGIGNAILYIIGLTVGLIFSIAVLVGVFLAAVGMSSPDQASQIYSQLKKNFAQSLLNLSSIKHDGGCQASEEEIRRMEQEIVTLREANRDLVKKVAELERSRNIK